MASNNGLLQKLICIINVMETIKVFTRPIIILTYHNILKLLFENDAKIIHQF